MAQVGAQQLSPRSVIFTAILLTAVGAYAKLAQTEADGTGKLPAGDLGKVVGGSVVAGLILMGIAEVSPKTAEGLALVLMVGGLALDGTYLAKALDNISGGVSSPGTKTTVSATALTTTPATTTTTPASTTTSTSKTSPSFSALLKSNLDTVAGAPGDLLKYLGL